MSQTKEQLRRLRQKYHLGEYSKRHTPKTSQRRIKKHKHSRYPIMARRKRRYSRHRKGFTSGIGATLIGAGAYVVYEAVVKPRLPIINQYGLMSNIGELALGLWLSKRSGIIGSAAKTAVVINAYQLLAGLMQNVLPTTTGNAELSVVKVYS